MRSLRLFTAVSSLALVVGSVQSFAQDAPAAGAQASNSGGLEEVVVTARRKAEVVQNVPVSVTALSGRELEQKSINTVDDIQFHVPELQVNPSQYLLSAEPSFTLRGLSTTVPGTTIADSAVTVYLGDVPVLYNRDIGHSLYDLADVQVLRGPQGTLFGKNSTGGAVVFDPKKPGFDFEAFAQATFGDYNLYEFTGAVNVPINDKLQIRFAGKLGRRDGYTRNLLGPDFNDENFQSGRLSIAFAPTDWFDNYTLIDASDSHENIVIKETTGIGGPALALYGAGAAGFFTNPALGAFQTVQAQFARQQALGTDAVATKDPNSVDLDTYTVTNVSTVHLSDDYTFKNIVSYQHSHSLFQLNNGALLYDYAAPLNNPDTASQVSEEAQLLGKSFNDKLDWIFGVFYGHQDDSNINNNTIFTDYNPAFNSMLPAAQIHDIGAVSTDDSTALFAHGTYDLDEVLPGLKFSAGYRYTWDDRSLLLNFRQQTADFGTFSMVNSCPLAGKYPNCISTFAKTFQSPSWTVGFDYHATDKIMFYVASRKGFKSGGFNSTSAIPGTQEYQSEKITDVEVGMKADWELGTVPLRTNVSLYRGELDNPTIPLLPVFEGSPNQVLQNVEGATIRGLEFEFLTKPLPQLDLSGSYSLTVSEYSANSKFVTAYGPGGTISGLQSLAGQPITQSSKHTAQVSARWDFQTDPRYGDLSIEADYAWRSSQLTPGQGATDASGNLIAATLPAFGLVNVRADLTQVGGYPLDVSFWVKNLTDKRYVTTEQLFVNVLGINNVTYGNPRTIGATLIYRW
jgi:iron complex outermembrane receptor protein